MISKELKDEGKLPPETGHRQVKYLNNFIEADHGKRKQLIRPARGFKKMKTIYATIKGFEVMRTLKKGQGRCFDFQGGIKGEVRMIERAFGLGPCAMSEVMGRFKFEAQRLERSGFERRCQALRGMPRWVFCIRGIFAV